MSATPPHPTLPRRPGSRRHGALAAVLVAVLVAGGLLLVPGALALVPAGPAGAATPPAGGTAGAGTSLGGFTVSALAEAATATYEQPNAPIPATPTLELDEGYASTTDNFGPTGSATASTLYPGQVIANAGPELGAFVPGVPLPAAPVWPVQAASDYPQTPNTATDDQPGVAMEASSSATTNIATSQLGNAPSGTEAPCATTGSGGSGGSGSGLPTGLPTLPAAAGGSATKSLGAKTASTGKAAGTAGATGSGTGGLGATSAVVQIQGLSGTSASGTAGSVATATATATDSCISILGGLVTIGSVTSTATATSDGSKGQVAGATTVQDAVVGGQPVTIDSSGVHAAGQSSPANPVLATLQQALTQLGITLTVTNPTDSVTGPQASRELDGLRVQIDLTTLDKAAQQFTALVPAQVTAELPVPVPNKQIMVLDLGKVDVQSTASPGFETAALGSGTGATTAAAGVTPTAAGAAGTVAGVGSTSLGLGGATGTGAYGTYGTSGTAGTGGTGGGPGGTGTAGTGRAVPATESSSSVPLAFKGIGAGLVLLGLLAAAVLGYASMRAGSAADTLPGGAACALGDGDAGDGDPTDDEGGAQ